MADEEQKIDYSGLLNQQINDLRDSPTFAVGKKADAIRLRNTGKAEKDKEPLFDFSLGQPAEPAPRYVREELITMMQDEKQWAKMSLYSPTNGYKSLRDAIAVKLKEENGLEYNDKQILVSNGGKQAIFNAFAVTLKPGDEVLLPEPSWVSYEDMVKWQGAKPVAVETDEKFKINILSLLEQMNPDRHPNVKWLVLNSPSNPTGATYSKGELTYIADAVKGANQVRKERGMAPIMVMSDDIYEHMVYDKFLDPKSRQDKDRLINGHGVSYNVAMVDEGMVPYTLIINGVSKAFAMTGWRVGYAAGPEDLIKAMAKFQGLTTSGVSTVAQLGAQIAMTHEKRHEVFNTQRENYIARRALVKKLLDEHFSEHGLSYAPTPGAFYAMIDVTKHLEKFTEPTAEEQKTGKPLTPIHRFANWLIEKFGVAMVPGDDFYVDPQKQKRHFVRMSFASDNTEITNGLGAMMKAGREIMPEGGYKAGGRGRA